MKTAVVHDWLVTRGGAERVLEEILKLYPGADLFCLFDFLSPGLLPGKKTKTSFMQRLPLTKKHYRKMLPLMPLAARSLRLNGYGLVISSSHAVAKGVRVPEGALHICYCHTPMRYAWDLKEDYLEGAGLQGGLKGLAARHVLERIRDWDRKTAAGVHRFVANSRYISERISRCYGRRSAVIYPPVDIDIFGYDPNVKREDYFFTASRMVPYKKMEIIVQAFAKTGHKLVVGGTGPELERLKKLAAPDTDFTGELAPEELRGYLQRARAFVFAAEEDFGILPVEAQACGTPVIAYGRGGVTETVAPGVTGLFYPEQRPDYLASALRVFERMEAGFEGAAMRANAERFGAERFRAEFGAYVQAQLAS